MCLIPLVNTSNKQGAQKVEEHLNIIIVNVLRYQHFSFSSTKHILIFSTIFVGGENVYTHI